MANKEKVIKSLEFCTVGNVCVSKCSYFNEFSMADGKCITQLQADALSLLKEQEQRINELKEKLRLLEYGDQDTLQGAMMPAT